MEKKLNSLKKVFEDFKACRPGEDFDIEYSMSSNSNDRLYKIYEVGKGLVGIIRVGGSKFIYSISKDYPDLEILCEEFKEGDF